MAKLALARALLRTACTSASAVDPAAGAGAAVALPTALLPVTRFAADTPAMQEISLGEFNDDSVHCNPACHTSADNADESVCVCM